METVNFCLYTTSDVDHVWERLEYYGCTLLYSSEDDKEKIIVGTLPKNMGSHELQEHIPEIQDIKNSSLARIDWEAQWAAHSVGYRKGYVHLDLHDYTVGNILLKPATIQLKAGPGFGDLSHPTTRLVLRLMANRVPGKHVIDIGSGSGILSLAACAMGASFVEGIDIDPAALIHARENSRLNGMEKQISFFLIDDYEMTEGVNSKVILMNMIQSEQQQAWTSLSMLHACAKSAITSGILSEGRDSYLELMKTWGWRLVEEAEEEGWLAFCFLPR